MKLTVLTYNTLFAGRDGADERRVRAQLGMINDVKPDVFLMQEAKGYDANGGAWLYEMEQSLNMRGFLATAPHTGQHVAIFIRSPLRPVSFEADGDHFHHALATLRVALGDTGRQITFKSAHLSPAGAAIRQREASYLALQAAPEQLTLLTGDFNSVSHHDPEPEDFDSLAPHHRIRYLADDLKLADRRVLGHLEAAGWVDVGHALGQGHVPTVPTSDFAGTEFATMRCDYVMATAALARYASSYVVLRNDVTAMASDHYPVLATFELPD